MEPEDSDWPGLEPPTRAAETTCPEPEVQLVWPRPLVAVRALLLAATALPPFSGSWSGYGPARLPVQFWDHFPGRPIASFHTCCE